MINAENLISEIITKKLYWEIWGQVIYWRLSNISIKLF